MWKDVYFSVCLYVSLATLFRLNEFCPVSKSNFLFPGSPISIGTLLYIEEGTFISEIMFLIGSVLAFRALLSKGPYFLFTDLFLTAPSILGVFSSYGTFLHDSFLHEAPIFNKKRTSFVGSRFLFWFSIFLNEQSFYWCFPSIFYHFRELIFLDSPVPIFNRIQRLKSLNFWCPIFWGPFILHFLLQRVSFLTIHFLLISLFTGVSFFRSSFSFKSSLF